MHAYVDASQTSAVNRTFPEVLLVMCPPIRKNFCRKNAAAIHDVDSDEPMFVASTCTIVYAAVVLSTKRYQNKPLVIPAPLDPVADTDEGTASRRRGVGDTTIRRIHQQF